MHVPHWVQTTLVVAHVLGATVWVGGTVALTFVAVPAIRLLTGEPRANAMRALGQRWRPLGWGALIAMVATGAPLAAEVLPGSGAAPKIVFGVKMALFAALLCTASLHDFVIGPKVAKDMRETGTSPLRPRLVLVGWASFTLTVTIPILGVVLAEIL